MRKLMLYGVILFQIGLIISLVRGVQLSRRSTSRIALMEETKTKLQDENENLKKEEEYVKGPYYLEKVARDELHLSKPGETVVIVPEAKKLDELQDKKMVLGQESQNKPNWMKWWDVLSGN